MLFSDIKNRVALLAQDPTMELAGDTQYGDFVNDAVRDLIGYGWLTPIAEDSSIVFASSTFEYAIPANWAYISEIREQSNTTPSNFDYVVPQHQYRLGYLAGGAYVIFDSFVWQPRPGKLLKLVGQKRPTTYAADSETIEPLFEAFILNRAACFALQFMAALPEPNADTFVNEVEGASPPNQSATAPGQMAQRTRALLAIAQQKWQQSEKFAMCHPMEFRVRPSSRRVPGR